MAGELLRSALLSFGTVARGLQPYTAIYGGLSSFQRRMERSGFEGPARASLAILGRLRAARAIPIPGGWIATPRGNEEDVMVSLFQTFIAKEYELDSRYVPKRGDVVVDAGAFVGLWTIRASRLVGDSGRVLSVEPNPSTLPQLETNLRLNGLRNVTLVRRALGSTPGGADFYLPSEGSGSAAASLFLSHTESVVALVPAEHGVVRVRAEVTTLDHLLREEGVARVDLLKLDIEGAELSVLEGARGSLASGVVAALIVEVHEDACATEDVLSLLAGAGFVADRVVRALEECAGRALVFARYEPGRSRRTG